MMVMMILNSATREMIVNKPQNKIAQEKEQSYEDVDETLLLW